MCDKEVFAPPGSVHRDLFTPPIGVKHQGDNLVHASSGHCIPAGTAQEGSSELPIQC